MITYCDIDFARAGVLLANPWGVLQQFQALQSGTDFKNSELQSE